MALSVRIVRVCDSLPKRRSTNVIGYQLLRAGTSPAAQYREGIRSRSDAEFVSKLENALQELDETAYWLDLLVQSELVTERKLAFLRREVDELTAIFVTCVKKVKARGKSEGHANQMTTFILHPASCILHPSSFIL